MKPEAERIQKNYYKETATQYDKMHVSDSDEHARALGWVKLICSDRKINKILDVGCGTGRAFFNLKTAGFQVMGVEPSEDLLGKAIEKGALPSEIFLSGGERLPFSDGYFDAACEFGVLHHVENPNLIIQEMMRVASKAIFISDSNRFGQGTLVMRWVKLFIYRVGLWSLFTWIRTRGKKYMVSEGDGLFYSYSIYDSLSLLKPWAEEIFLIPTEDANSKSWFQPLLTAPTILLCAIKK